MKKVTLLLTILSLAVVTQAQTYDNIKSSLLLGQTKKAKEDVDKRMENAKFASKAEAYILKSTVYATLASDSATQGTTEGEALLSEAETAFKKYKEMDPELSLITDPVYKNAAINIYSVLFNTGYNDYRDKAWDKSFGKFEKVLDYSEILYNQKLLASNVDTNSLVLAAYTAENAGKRDKAAQYYSRLADAGVEGPNYESIYRFLVTYNFEKKNMEAFEKYKGQGAKLYPESEFFTYDQTDFAIGLEEDFDAKLKALEQVLAKDPTNYKANLSYGQIIYDTLHSEKDDAVMPANAAELEKKMVEAFTRAGNAKPDDELAWLVIGDHYINKSIDISDEQEAHSAEMKKRTKPGAKPSAEDQAKKDALDKEYAAAFDGAIEPYAKAAELYSKRETLNGVQKQQYKKAAGYLGDIYTYKISKSKGMPAAEVAKLRDAEKKWNDLYVSIK